MALSLWQSVADEVASMLGNFVADTTQIFIMKVHHGLLMAKLPAWSWLAVGLIIAVTSWYVEMTLFFWLGWVFIIIGAAKFLIWFMARRREAPDTIMHHPHHRAVHAPAAHPSRGQARLGHYAHVYHRCVCGNPVRVTDLFCSACGRRLR